MARFNSVPTPTTVRSPMMLWAIFAPLMMPAVGDEARGQCARR